MTYEITTPYASLTRRFGALVLDFLILLIPCAIGSHLIPFLGGIAVWFFYGPILESSELRATFGKHLMGIQVVDSAGRRISFRAALIRNALKLVSGLILFLGFIFALFSPKRQTLHDLLAETFVVYGRSTRHFTDAWSAQVKNVFHSVDWTAKESASAATLAALERLQALRQNGTLTEEEFQAQKKKILET
jgi:uncharacterized RDD family membrane protein YckC